MTLQHIASVLFALTVGATAAGWAALLNPLPETVEQGAEEFGDGSGAVHTEMDIAGAKRNHG